jgi:hypothetical protein
MILFLKFLTMCLIMRTDSARVSIEMKDLHKEISDILIVTLITLFLLSTTRGCTGRIVKILPFYARVLEFHFSNRLPCFLYFVFDWKLLPLTFARETNSWSQIKTTWTCYLCLWVLFYVYICSIAVCYYLLYTRLIYVSNCIS